MSMTWAQFQAAVIALITDRTPNETGFTEAVAEYVRARIASELTGNSSLYSLHENRYRALRRRLAGFQTQQSDAALKAAVRAAISDGAANDTTFAYAVSLWCKAHIALEVDRNAAMFEQWMVRYREARLKLLGYMHGLGAGLQAAVEKYLPVDASRANVAGDFLAAHMQTAALDVQGLDSWLTQQLVLAKAELQGLNERVARETINAVLDLQHFIPSYRKGQETFYTWEHVQDEGHASRGQLPAGAEIREAWIIYPTNEAVLCHRAECVLIPWESRFDLICEETPTPHLTIDPQGQTFYATPPMEEDEVMLQLVWDGKRTDFGANDIVPLDEGAVKAAAFYVQSELAIELGDPISVSRDYRARYESERTNAWLSDQRRRGVRNAKTPEEGEGGGCSRPRRGSRPEEQSMIGYETYRISAATVEDIAYSVRLRTYKLRIELGSGLADYTAEFRLHSKDRFAGHEIEALVRLPASNFPTLIIRDFDSQGALVNFKHDGVAGWYNGKFIFDGSKWEVFGWARVGA